MKKLNENMIIISSYPQKGQTHGVGTVGVASYTKNVLKGIRQNAFGKKIKMTVLAEKLHNEATKTYTENNIEVKRSWERNHPGVYVMILREILNYPQVKNVLIAFELAMFGNTLLLLGLPVFLLILKMLGKNITFIMHQVVTDIESVAPHVGMQKKSLFNTFLNLLIHGFYRFTFVFTDEIIVFEQYLKKQLSRFITADKISVIPHGVEKKKTVAKSAARRLLKIKRNEYVVLCFGFIAWYKGTDKIAKLFKKLPNKIGNKKVRLIIAGGGNPNHAQKSYYKKYIAAVHKYMHSAADKITITGFVPESELALYFSAADLVALPYRTLMSSSGPLSLALTYKKPYIISADIAPIFMTDDAKEVMLERSVDLKDFTFDHSAKSLQHKLQSLVRNPQKERSLQQFSDTLGKSRDFQKIGILYLQTLYEKNKNVAADTAVDDLSLQYRRN